MTDPTPSTLNVLNRVVEQTTNDSSALADACARLEPFAIELIQGWNTAFGDIAARGALAGDATARASQDEFVGLFFGELKRANPRQAINHLADWSQQLANLGLSYDLAVELLQDYQRVVIDLIVRAYGDEPQIPLALDAFADLFSNTVAILGATYATQASPLAPTLAPPDASDARWLTAHHYLVLGHLTEGMTHALNNLMASLLGHTQLLLERASDFEIRDELEEIQATAAASARIIRRIQDYAGAGATTRHSVDVNLILRDTSDITRFVWRDRTELKGIVIDVVKDFTEIPPVLANPSELRRAFVAILMNAVEALPDGGLVTLRTERKGDHVVVSITDNGKGMRGDIRMNASQPFFTTKDAPHVGLGLTIARDIITAHGGEIALNPKIPTGTTVSINLPITQGSSEKGDSKMARRRPANVLVIDNEESVRNLLARLLKIQGHTVVAAESGSAGITEFKNAKFDAVLTDLGMPEISGWDVAREIKKLNPTVLVALTTGWPLEMTPEELKAKNVDRIVNKPFDLPLLFSLIDEAVALSQD